MYIGFFHLGVLRTLVNARLLPRVISGASTGSVMASLICTLNEQDRIDLLNSPPSWIPRVKIL
jgi:predicted acylesterase/phospholipase RssA